MSGKVEMSATNAKKIIALMKTAKAPAVPIAAAKKRKPAAKKSTRKSTKKTSKRK